MSDNYIKEIISYFLRSEVVKVLKVSDISQCAISAFVNKQYRLSEMLFTMIDGADETKNLTACDYVVDFISEDCTRLEAMKIRKVLADVVNPRLEAIALLDKPDELRGYIYECRSYLKRINND